MPNKKSNSSKLNGSSEIFANFLRELMEEAVAKDRDETIKPLMDLGIETKEEVNELKKSQKILNQNMNARFLAQDKRFTEQDKRFAEQDKRFAEQDKKFDKIFTQIGALTKEVKGLSGEIRKR